MMADRVLINKIGNRLVFATDYSNVDHQYGETRSVCFHKPGTELKEEYVVNIEYEREKKIANLPLMLVGISKIQVVSRRADPDLLLDL